MRLLFGLDMRTPASGKEAVVPARDLPGDPSLEHLKNQARALQHRVRPGDPDTVAAVGELKARLADAASGSPDLPRYHRPTPLFVLSPHARFAPRTHHPHTV